ncbi:MAG: hypothetical protein AAB456_00135 [Patescibacteria group bacterium]
MPPKKLTIEEMLAGIAKQVNDARAEFKANFNLLADRIQKLEQDPEFELVRKIHEVTLDRYKQQQRFAIVRYQPPHDSLVTDSRVYNVNTKITFGSVVEPGVFDKASKEAWGLLRKFCEDNNIDEIHLDAKKQTNAGT